jgi:aspartyl-tRNA(Asn)/glutamyl-tRNA(Gln) amidotransferase subunit B
MDTTYVPTIGLEIHAELKTSSKMFCGCVNDPDNKEPNAQLCPVCMAHPGTLPVINKEAVRHVLRVGTAVGGTLADFTEFDRKNYFYPDIPKNYQISQYKYPLVEGGSIGPVEITRIHLEEDTARSTHDANGSNVDYNRAGVPLMELVTEPVIHDAVTAVSFAQDLMLLLRYLGASDANLEKGEMRVEANISIAKKGEKLGTKVEVKNLNSFKAVEQAIAFEIKRHAELLARGEKVIQETRGWDENKQRTFSQRLKEESHDYRYFPDPDLPKLYVSEIEGFGSASLKETLPTLPWELRERYLEKGMQEQTARLLVQNTALNELYMAVTALLTDEKDRVLATNYLTSDLWGAVSKPDYNGRPLGTLEAEHFAALITLVSSKKLSSRGAKDVLSEWLNTGEEPQSLARSMHLEQVSDESELQTIVNTVLEEHASVADEYRNGKDSALQFLIGQGMKATKGSADPTVLKALLVTKLK